jgi:hypothetical protein
MPDATNDDDPVQDKWIEGPVDAHGEAALLLVESLIHALIGRSALQIEEAIDIVQVAADAAFEMHGERGGKPTETPASRGLLAAIVRTLEIDADKPTLR